VSAEVAFTVHGIPVPQGSKNQWGGEANRNLKPWRATVAAAAAEALAGAPPFAGPVQVRVHFVFPRPAAHYGTGRNAGTLKPSAPHWRASSPDLDKLQRAIGDALAGTLLRDDRQVVSWQTWKLYGEPARADILVLEMTTP
jgi:crossover junction endodeoxyribonuclease RusA